VIRLSSSLQVSLVQLDGGVSAVSPTMPFAFLTRCVSGDLVEMRSFG
jgi:hypothetical protein